MNYYRNITRTVAFAWSRRHRQPNSQRIVTWLIHIKGRLHTVTALGSAWISTNKHELPQNNLNRKKHTAGKRKVGIPTDAKFSYA